MGLDITYYKEIELIREPEKVKKVLAEAKKEEKQQEGDKVEEKAEEGKEKDEKREDEGEDEGEDEDEDEEEDYGTDDDEDGHFRLYQEKGYEARSDNLIDGKYKGEYGGSFAAGYRGFFEFRCNLYTAIGGKKWTTDFLYPFPLTTDGEPFAELINMSDCEGFIGPVTSHKLYQDFLKYSKKAEKNLSKYQFEQYLEWQAAFECARQGGVVKFH